MNFPMSDEQRMLSDSLTSFLADNYRLEDRQAALRSDDGWRPDIWRRLAEELGILGATFSEEAGGLGGGATEALIIMDAMGEALVLEPYLPTAVIGGGLLKGSRCEAANEWIERIIAGSAVFAFAHGERGSRYSLSNIATRAARSASGWRLSGEKSVVTGAPWASHLIVTARSDTDASFMIFLVERGIPGLQLAEYRTIDGSRAADVKFDGAEVPAAMLIASGNEGEQLFHDVMDEAIVATCAEACGVIRRLFNGTLEYTKSRKQFGQPLANFQVLRHRMVEMYLHLERACAMTVMATSALSDARDARKRAVAAAKVTVGQACRFVGQNAVQLHGGIGMTDELYLGHFFKRATLLEYQFGSTDHHLAEFERLSA